MGIRQLLQELRKKCRKAIRPFDPDDFGGKIAAADAAGLMYVAIAGRVPGDESGFLQRFLDEWRAHLERGLLLIWVLDGDGSNPAKAKENEARRAQRTKALVAAEKKATSLIERADELQRRAKSTESAEVMLDLMMESMDARQEANRASDCPTAKVSRKHYDELRRLFRRERIPFVTAKTEGEKCCAWMARQGLVDLVMTDDSDALAYGAPLVYFNPWVNSPSRPKQIFDLPHILKELQLTQIQFVELCSLLDNDFNKGGTRLNGMSFDVAYRLLRAHGSVEKWTKTLSYRIHCNKPSVRNSQSWSYLPPFEEYTDPTPQFAEHPDPENSNPPRRCLMGLDNRLVVSIAALWDISDLRAEDLLPEASCDSPLKPEDNNEQRNLLNGELHRPMDLSLSDDKLVDDSDTEITANIGKVESMSKSDEMDTSSDTEEDEEEERDLVERDVISWKEFAITAPPPTTTTTTTTTMTTPLEKMEDVASFLGFSRLNQDEEEEDIDDTLSSSSSKSCTPVVTPDGSPVLGRVVLKRKSPTKIYWQESRPKCAKRIHAPLALTRIPPQPSSSISQVEEIAVRNQTNAAMLALESNFASFEVTWHLEPTYDEETTL